MKKNYFPFLKYLFFNTKIKTKRASRHASFTNIRKFKISLLDILRPLENYERTFS